MYLLSGSGPACIQLCALGTAADSVPYATVDDATCSRGAGVPVQEGDSCNFTCTESGTVLVGGGNDAVGPATMTCSGGSLVHAGSLFCALPCVSDPAIDELDFNNSFCEGTAHNSTCSFQCAGNFTTAGNGTARCFDGSWIDSDYCAAQCDGTPASSLEHFAFDAANATQEAACRDAPHGTLCPFECGSTFVPVSRLLPGKTAPASVQCLDGEWQTADLRCEAPCLSTPNIPFSLLQEPDCNGKCPVSSHLCFGLIPRVATTSGFLVPQSHFHLNCSLRQSSNTIHSAHVLVLFICRHVVGRDMQLYMRGALHSAR